MSRRLAAFLLTGLLAACVTPAPDRPNPNPIASARGDFSLAGRISVRQGDKPFAGNVRWEHLGTTDRLLFSTPLGQGVAEIAAVPGTVVLRMPDQPERVAQDADSLIEDVLGARLPLAGLAAWVTGAVAPGSDGRTSLNGAGDVVRIDQDGWTIEFARHEPVGERRLPRRIVAQREGVEVRLVVDEWALP